MTVAALAPIRRSLLPHHAELIARSGISDEVAAARGYYSASEHHEIKILGFANRQIMLPALVVPIYDVNGRLTLHQVRPDSPRVDKGGRPIKYETQAKHRLCLDVPPTIRRRLTDPAEPLWITEGARKADAAVSAGLCCIALLGVWGWRGTNGDGGRTALPCWEAIALNGRDVFVCFDSDVTTKREVESALDRLRAFLERRGGRVHVVRLRAAEDGSKVGLDDYLAAGHTVDELRALVDAGHHSETTLDDAAVRFPFRLTTRAVEYAEERDGESEWARVCSRLEVVALTRSDAGEDWGALLRWQDADGRTHEWAMPWELLAGIDGREWLGELMRGGLIVAPGTRTRQHLHEYLTTTRPTARVRCVSRVGWHDRVFVLPDATVGAAAEAVRLQTAAPLNHAFRVSGTLDDWQREVAALCVGNSRLALAVSAAFAASLLALVDAESGGFHFRGASSVGKTTALRVAGSVWGGGGVRGYIGTWRATANGLEAVAASHCDALLCLDELSEVEAREAGMVAYMLANGTGKQRARRDGGARTPTEWRLLFLSSGELGLADKVREDGKRRATAGQAVRVVDVPADAGAGLGLFASLHGLPDAGTLAQRLGAATSAFYGTGGREFVARVAEERDETAAAVRYYRDRFLEAHAPKDADGQVRRVVERFALVAAAGELATALGVVPWTEGEATAAAEACLRAWLAERGGTGPAELSAGLERVQAFFLEHGESRFDPVEGGDDARAPVRGRAGWWATDSDGRRMWFVLPRIFRDELAIGCDPRAVARACIEHGFLLPAKNGSPTRTERVGGGKPRVYVFKPAVLDSDDKQDA
jgi:uncharacterized protein (DUF927 family)